MLEQTCATPGQARLRGRRGSSEAGYYYVPDQNQSGAWSSLQFKLQLQRESLKDHELELYNLGELSSAESGALLSFSYGEVPLRDALVTLDQMDGREEDGYQTRVLGMHYTIRVYVVVRPRKLRKLKHTKPCRSSTCAHGVVPKHCRRARNSRCFLEFMRRTRMRFCAVFGCFMWFTSKQPTHGRGGPRMVQQHENQRSNRQYTSIRD